MAYRRTEKVEQRLAARRTTIIAAASALAAERGMGAVQIAPVAERAGIAAGTVYRYFPSKAELVAALVAAVAEREIATMRQAADAAPGPLSALSAVILTLAVRAVQNRKLAWAVIAEPVDAEIDHARIAYRSALVAEIRGRLAATMAEGQVPEHDPALAAPALIGAMLEALVGPLASDLSDKPGQIREAAQMLTLFALRAIGIPDAHARGLIVQTALPEAKSLSHQAVWAD